MEKKKETKIRPLWAVKREKMESGKRRGNGLKMMKKEERKRMILSGTRG